MRKPIVLYRERYLPASETFIYEQIKHLKEYHPFVLCTEITSEGLKCFPYPYVYRLRDIKSKLKQLRRKGVKLIYARFGMGGVKMLSLKRESRLPMLTSFHGSDVSRQIVKNKKYRQSLPLLFEFGDMFTVVCEYMKKALIELGCPERKITVLKSGIDLSKFPYQPKKSQNIKKPRILCVGRLVEKKGMNYLIEAFSKVVKKFPRARLVIVGEGEQREYLEDLIKEHQLESSVELKGLMNHEEVRSELVKCDLFALASCRASDGNEEGIPNAIMEAMAIGRPVVATDHAGIPELVKHMETGYLVPERDADKLEEMMVYALKHSEDWKEIIERARREVEQEHDIEKQIEKLERLMDQMLTKKKESKRESKRAMAIRKRRIKRRKL